MTSINRYAKHTHMKLILIISLLSYFSLHFAHTSTLVMIGGGQRPKEALAALLPKSKSYTNVLVLPWGTAEQDLACDNMKNEFMAIKPVRFQCLLVHNSPQLVNAALELADVLYFPGGDQSKLMLELIKHDLVKKIKMRFKKTLNVGGTSAGTAIQSKLMITGKGIEVGNGIGLVDDYIIDQHFLVRQRQSRLISILKRQKMSGIGIDEGTALIVQDKSMKVIGKSEVWIYKWPRVNSPIKFKSGDLINFPIE